MTNSLIEKLEALPRYAHDFGGMICTEVPIETCVWVNIHDLRAIIEQAKVEQSEPVAWYVEDYLTWDSATAKLWESRGWFVSPFYPALPDQSARIKELEQILHDPENQPSQYGTMPLIEYEKIVAQRDRLVADLAKARKDAERWRKLRSLICNAMSGVAVTYFAGTDFHTVQDAEMLDSVIDQAMKGQT